MTVSVTVNGQGQAGFIGGYARLVDASGNVVSTYGLQALSGNDSTGNPILTGMLTGIPVNTSSSVHTYTLNVLIEDYTGVTTTAVTTLTQLAGSAPSLSSTSLFVPTRIVAIPGETRILRGTLTATGVAVSGKTITFTVNGNTVGTAITDATGLAKLRYLIPFGAAIGNEVLGASFVGDSTFAASTGQGQIGVK